MVSLIETTITVGARASPLSRAQVQEVLQALQQHFPHLSFASQFALSKGDKDQITSLRGLEKTNFFTEEIDQMLLDGECRITIHSAKDLPDPLTKGLKLIALTEGIDSRDSLVLRSGETLASVKTVATSSTRREACVRMIHPNCACIDLRGTIHQRLEKLTNGEADAIVVAECALIRLGLTTLPRIYLPGPTTPLQGKLAVLAREDDKEMEALFRPLDTREQILYFGLTPPKEESCRRYHHFPLIQIAPKPKDDEIIQRMMRELCSFTHIILTSKTAVRCLFSLSTPHRLRHHLFICVGTHTARVLQEFGPFSCLIAQNETAEGVCALLDTLSLEQANVLWPHSAQARPVISNYLDKKKIRNLCAPLYDTFKKEDIELPNLDDYEALVFTSPSTVDAYFSYWPSLPKNKQIHCIGPITHAKLVEKGVQL